MKYICMLKFYDAVLTLRYHKDFLEFDCFPREMLADNDKAEHTTIWMGDLTVELFNKLQKVVNKANRDIAKFNARYLPVFEVVKSIDEMHDKHTDENAGWKWAMTGQS